MSAERRSDRTRVSIPATVRVGSRTYRDVVADLSLSGLFLEAESERLRPGERIRVAFSLPAGERTIPVEIDGEIARVVKNPIHRTKGMGVRFISPRASVIDAITAFLKSKGSETHRPSTPGPKRGAAPAAPPVPARRYDFSAEAPDLDENDQDTDPRFSLSQEGAADTIDDGDDLDADTEEIDV